MLQYIYMITPLLVFKDWGLLILRLTVAVIYFAHGWPKLKNLKTTQQNLGMMGFKPGWFWGTIVALLESAASVLFILGLGTQAVAFLLAIQMLVAIFWKIKIGNKFVGGYELDLLLVACLLTLATSGGGAFSLDNSFRLF